MQNFCVNMCENEITKTKEDSLGRDEVSVPSSRPINFVKQTSITIKQKEKLYIALGKKYNEDVAFVYNSIQGIYKRSAVIKFKKKISDDGRFIYLYNRISSVKFTCGKSIVVG